MWESPTEQVGKYAYKDQRRWRRLWLQRHGVYDRCRSSDRLTKEGSRTLQFAVSKSSASGATYRAPLTDTASNPRIICWRVKVQPNRSARRWNLDSLAGQIVNRATPCQTCSHRHAHIPTILGFEFLVIAAIPPHRKVKLSRREKGP